MTGDAGYSIINHIISEGRVPSTIFCINDPIAMGAMQALLDAEIKVPEDVSIIGFNDVEACNFTRPTLSTTVFWNGRNRCICSSSYDYRRWYTLSSKNSVTMSVEN